MSPTKRALIKEYTFTIKIGKPIKYTDLSSHNDIATQQLRYKSESLKKVCLN